MGKVLVRGSINIDEFFNVPHIVNSGETISSTGYSRRAGGKGANQAASAAKAGATTDLAATIGHDGEFLLENLKSLGVGLDLMKKDDELPTGRALIQLSTSTHDNSIILLGGSNHSSSSLPFPSSSSSSSTYSTVLLQNEIPLTTTSAWLSQAHERGMTTIFNPSPMLSDAEIRAFAWSKVTWLVVNEGEGRELLRALSGSKEVQEGDERGLLRALAAMGGEQGTTSVLLTKGADGVTAFHAGEFLDSPAGKVVGGVKDTTGAGDCFTGYFATLISSPGALEGKGKEEGLKAVLTIASAASAMCVEKEGAMESYPGLDEVKARMADDWPSGW